MLVLVTGAGGFVGKNLCARLRSRNIDYIAAYRTTTPIELHSLLDRCDFVVHLAGENRPLDDNKFQEVNVLLTQNIVNYLIETKKSVPIFLSSSIHAALKTPYGISKLKAEVALEGYNKSTGADIHIERLKNVFGKWSKPNYNSAVATFCYKIAHGEPIEITNPSNLVELTYIDDVVDCIVSKIDSIDKSAKSQQNINKFIPSYSVQVGELARLIESFNTSIATNLVPDLSDAFTKKLFSTYVSFLPEEALDLGLLKREDPRGWLFELVKSESFGQIFISKTIPGITRGNHYHNSKVEKFCVIQGQAEINLRSINSTKKTTYTVNGENISLVNIPPGYTHSIKNVGETEMITIFWANEIFDPNFPDTIAEEV